MKPRVAIFALMGLLVLTAVAYMPAWHGQPLWDDGGHLTRPDLQSLDGLRRIWVEPGATQQYYPVLHSAFWLEHQLWGQAPLGYHLANIVWHALSAWLVLLILRRLGLPGAAFAAVLFAVHPVHVESVAWISEQKNTLSGVFALGALLLYLRFDATRRRREYALALGLFALALLSKSVTATLPVVIAILLWWQRGTLRWREDVRPVLPLVAMSLAAGLTTVMVERSMIGAQGETFLFSWMDRVLVAGRAAWFYLWTLIWPSGLTFNYPRWAINAGVWWQWLFPVAMVGTLSVLWWRRDQWGRGPLAALLVFLAAVAPALGFVNVYPFRFSFVADHFQYLASLGVIAAMAAGMATAVARWRVAPVTRRALAALVCVPLAVLTWQQSHDYVDAETLYRATLTRNPESWLAHTNLAALLLERPGTDPRVPLGHARAAAGVMPDSPAVQYTLGQALEQQGDADEAATHYRAAIELFSPADYGFRHVRLAHAHHRLGVVLGQAGHFAEAIAAHRRALEYAPEDPDIHTDLAMALAQTRDFDRAIAHFETAVEHRHDSASLNNLAGAYMQAGRFDDAVLWLERAVSLDPQLVDAFYNMGTALSRLGRWTEAITAYQRVVTLTGPSADLLTRLGLLFGRAGDTRQAVRYLEEALRLDPTHELARSALRGGGLG